MTGPGAWAAEGGLPVALRARSFAGRLPFGDDGPPVTVPRDPGREAARRELSKRMYHEHEPSLFLRLLNRFWEWVDDLFGAASAATPGGAVGLAVIVLAVLALAGLLWWRLGTPRRTGATTAPLFESRPRTAADHRAAAEAHAAQGHWNRAVQERMRAVVRSLEERALLDVRPGRTADEAAADAATELPAHGDRLQSAAHDFDAVTYGGHAADQDTYQRLTVLDRDLAHTRPARPAPASSSAALHGFPGGGPA